MPRPPVLPTIEWKEVIAKSLPYEKWIEQGESPEHRAEMQAAMAAQKLSDADAKALAALGRTVHVVAIAEDWCGDVVRHVPVLEKMRTAATRLQTHYIAREDRPDVFARFLTNGGEAIPKFVFISENYVECGNWGPMPADCRELISRGKACGDVGAARKKVSALYDADPDRQVVVKELLHLAENAACSEP